MIYTEAQYKPLGDLYLTAEFGDELSLALNFRVIALDGALKARPLPGVTETIPTNRSLGIVYDPDRKSTRLNSSHSRASRMPSSA